MATEESGSPRRQGRTRPALAGIFVGVVAVGVFAIPASASAAPASVPSIIAVAAPVSPGATSPGQSVAGGGSGEPGDINVVMLAMVASLGLAIGVPLAGRARIARWRCVRRFREQLRNVDTIGGCLEDINRR